MHTIDKIELTDQQQAGLDLLTGDRNGVLKGYAGTGKTTLIGKAIEEAPNVLLLTPTNKAAMVLAEKSGHPTATIHSATMTATLVKDKRTGEDRLKFVEKPLAEMGAVSKIVIDEASMLSTRDWAKALNTLERTFGVGRVPPVVMVGDGFQLPPVESNTEEPGAFVDWQRSYPTIELTEVHRQEAGSTVLDFATRLRSADPGDYRSIRFSREFDKLKQGTPEWTGMLGAMWSGEGVILVKTNVHRINLLAEIRQGILGGGMIPPQEGDRLVSYASYRRNDGPTVLNGMSYTVLETARLEGGMYRFPARMEFTGEVEQHSVLPSLMFDPGQQYEWNRMHNMRSPYAALGSPVTYGYAMTAHKAQGSSWPYVAVANTNLTFVNDARWLYTAVTRAEKEVYVL